MAAAVPGVVSTMLIWALLATLLFNWMLSSNLRGAPEPTDVSYSYYYELVERMDRAIDEATANPYLTAAQRSLRLHLARVRKLSRTNPDRLARAAADEAATEVSLSCHQCSAPASAEPRPRTRPNGVSILVSLMRPSRAGSRPTGPR